MTVPGFNNKGEGGIILSETLNLTRITTWLAGIIGASTLWVGSATEDTAAASPTTSSEGDWLGFEGEQRLVFVVALVAAVAIVQATDLLARSLATSRAVSAAFFPLNTARAARKKVKTGDGEDVVGEVIALRSSDGHMLFYSPATKKSEWVGEDSIIFT